MDALMADMPAEHRAHHEAMMDAPGRVTKETAPARSSATAKSSARRAASPTTRRGTPAATKPAADPHAGHTTPAPKATKKPADPHAGHKMPDMPGMSPAKKP
jgi:copper resistance protein B